MRIAIFGGAFNPVHREHVNIARAAVRELRLDKIIIMPSAVSPHKSGRPCAGMWQRFEMCRLAFACIPEAEVSNYELTRGGVSYTYLTCRHFAQLYKDAERYLLIGADMLQSFDSWKYPEEILKDFSLAACAREESEPFKGYKEAVEQKFDTSVNAIRYVGERVSSTRIRTLAALGEDFSAYADPAVCNYIKNIGVYALPKIQKVRDMMPPKRWEHTVNVALLCAKNAARASITEEQAVTMAALHDCAKYLPADSPHLIGFTCPYGVPPPVVHQFSGEYVARNAFGITDETVLSAIACHTSGKAGMNGAEKLLFLADLLEPSRSFEGVEELRKLFKADLDKCLKAALKHQLDYLTSRGEPIYGATLEAYEYIANI